MASESIKPTNSVVSESMMFSETDIMLKVIIKPDAERIKLSSFYLWTINCYIRVAQAQCHILSVFVFNATQALSFSSGEGVHADFQKLNADINSPSASYILKLANRLYGENTAHFLPVSVHINDSLHKVLHYKDWINKQMSALCRTSLTPHRSTTRQTWRLWTSSELQRRAEQRSTAGSSSRQKVRMCIFHSLNSRESF